jgi:hypothetical protein
MVLAPPVIPGQPYHSYQVLDTLGRTVQFYLSEAKPGRRLPLVVFVQGSGASSLFRDAGNGHVTGASGTHGRDAVHPMRPPPRRNCCDHSAPSRRARERLFGHHPASGASRCGARPQTLVTYA